MSRRRIYSAWGIAVIFAAGAAVMLGLSAGQAARTAWKSGAGAGPLAKTRQQFPVEPGWPEKAEAMAEKAGKWAAELNEAEWLRGAVEVATLAGNGQDGRSGPPWSAWCGGLRHLPPRVFFEHLASGSGTLLPLLAAAPHFDHVQPLRRVTGMLVDAFASGGQSGELDQLLTGAPPELRARIVASRTAAEVANEFWRMERVPSGIRHAVELEVLARLQVSPDRMVDFILTRTGTLAASDNEILLAATALNFSEGRKGRVGIILAASPSPGRNALLAVGAGSALLLERSDRAALANAITDDALRTVIQSQMEAVNRLTFTDENVPSSKP